MGWKVYIALTYISPSCSLLVMFPSVDWCPSRADGEQHVRGRNGTYPCMMAPVRPTGNGEAASGTCPPVVSGHPIFQRDCFYRSSAKPKRESQNYKGAELTASLVPTLESDLYFLDRFDWRSCLLFPLAPLIFTSAVRDKLTDLLVLPCLLLDWESSLINC
jgi:hypothetical protein